MSDTQVVYAYHTNPIDFLWWHLPTVTEVMKKTMDAIVAHNDGDYASPTWLADFINNFNTSQHLAHQVGWKWNDFAEGPCVFYMPAEVEFSYGFVWKHSDNGSCFIISPVKLLSLDDDFIIDYKEIEVEWAKL